MILLHKAKFDFSKLDLLKDKGIHECPVEQGPYIIINLNQIHNIEEVMHFETLRASKYGQFSLEEEGLSAKGKATAIRFEHNDIVHVSESLSTIQQMLGRISGRLIS